MSWFKSLSFFELLWPLLFLIGYGLYYLRLRKAARVLEVRANRLSFKFVLRSLILLLLLTAWLGPSFGSSQREVKSIGKDIYFLIDLSRSMNAEDIQPSRLQKVKFELKRMVDALAGDRIGLIIFSSEAFVQSPLTYDQSALQLFIETLSTRLVPNAGTNFAPPLRMALEKLNEESTTARPKSKLIVLISDGEDFGDETIEAARKIQDSNIRLFTLGVGTEAGGRVPERGHYLRDEQGREVTSQLNDEALQKLARLTGGSYFEINQRRNETEKLINTLKGISGELQDTRKVDVSANKYMYFLALALALMVLDVLLHLNVVRL